jgi:hypothetical protein
MRFTTRIPTGFQVPENLESESSSSKAFKMKNKIKEIQ